LRLAPDITNIAKYWISGKVTGSEASPGDFTENATLREARMLKTRLQFESI
jgi:hypothetical protein